MSGGGVSTADGRILFGGWDAVYYFGGRVDARLEQRDSSHGHSTQREGHGYSGMGVARARARAAWA